MGQDSTPSTRPGSQAEPVQDAPDKAVEDPIVTLVPYPRQKAGVPEAMKSRMAPLPAPARLLGNSVAFTTRLAPLSDQTSRP